MANYFEDNNVPVSTSSYFDQGSLTNAIQGVDAYNRATMFNVALGDNSPGLDSLQMNISNGQEDYIRTQATNLFAQERQKKLLDNISRKVISGDETVGQSIQEYKNSEPLNPYTSVEKAFADRFFNKVYEDSLKDPNSITSKASQESPEELQGSLAAAKEVAARREVARKVFLDAKNIYQKQDYLSWGIDLAKGFIPLATGIEQSPDWNLSNIVLPGSSKELEREKFWSFTDTNQARLWLEARVKQIAAHNPMAALDFAHSMVDLPQTSVIAANTFGLLDVQGASSVVGALGKGAVATLAAKRMFRGALDGVTPAGKVDAAATLAATGDTIRASEVNAIKQFTKDNQGDSARSIFNAIDPIGAGEELKDKAQTLFNPDMLRLNSSRFTGEITDRLVGSLKQSGRALMSSVANPIRPPRIEEATFPTMLKEAKGRLELQYPSVNDGIQDVGLLYEKATNTHFAEYIITYPNGALGKTAEEMNAYALKTLGLDYKSFILRNTPTEKVINKSEEVLKEIERVKNLKEGDINKESIFGFNSIKGRVRLSDGSEVVVVNRKSAIYTLTGEKISPSNITSYKNSTKGSSWINVNSPKESPGVIDTTSSSVSLKSAKNPDITEGISATEEADAKAFGEALKEHLVKEGIQGEQPTAAREFIASTNTIVDEIKPGVEVKQLGNRWYISIVKPLNETSPNARGMQITTTNTNPTGNLGDYWIRGLTRGADAQLAYFQNINRHISVHVPQEMQKYMHEIAQEIRPLGKESLGDLNRVLEVNKNYVDRETGQRGRAYRSQDQLDKAWLDANNKLPSYDESLAYFRYHQLMDTDWVIRNFGVMRDLYRQGAELYTVGSGTDKSTSFIGRIESEFPWAHRENLGIVVHENGIATHYYKDTMPSDVMNYLKEKLNTGKLKSIVLGNLTDRPFKETHDIGRIGHWVITDELHVQPIPMNLVDYTPGVHVQYPHPFYVKQALNVPSEKGLTNFGAKTIFGADTPAEAERQAKAITQVQTMIRNKATDAELNAFIHGNLPKDAEYWRGQFVSEKEGVEPFLSLEHPIAAVPTGKDFYASNPHLRTERLVEEGNSEFNMMRSINMDFLANRDGPLMTMTRNGTAQRPIYNLELARTLDPFTSISRGLGNGVRSLITNDSKISAIEQWVAQNAKYFDNPDMARANPFYAFYHMAINPNTPRIEYNAAISTKERINNFLGTNSEFGRDMNYLQQRILNGLDKVGLARWYNDHELKLLKDPLGFTRSWMFNFRFGFFNPSQYIVQSSGFAHVAALAGPENASKAMSAYTLQLAMYQTNDQATLNRLANMATKMGWDKQMFMESYNTMRNLGFDIVGKEHAMREQSFDSGFLSFKGKGFIEWGNTPFIEGERLTRMTAWNAAFLEWRTANPNAELSNYNIGKILLRADDMSSNMTKASHSRLQEGIFAVPTQFYTYSHRMMEQFWGDKLTPKDKLRAFITHSIIFGLPVTAAIGIPWNIGDSLKTYLLENNSDLLDNGWYKAATQGFLNFFMYHMTGKDYNVEQRYGPGFSDQVKKLVDGELSAIEAFGGATGTFTKSLLRAAYPFYGSLKIGLFGGQEEFPLVKEDILLLAREISTVNSVHNAYFAMNAGKYFSKNGTFVQEGMDSKDAVAMMFGLTRRDIVDTRLIVASLKEQNDAQKKVQVFAEQEFRRAFQYMGTGEYNKAEVHYARAKALMVAIGDFTDALIMQTFTRSIDEGTPLAAKIRKDFTEKGNKSQLPKRLQGLYDGKYN